ncbi:MAG: 30S ribosomal protein S3 [Legionellales bacterium]|nr:MAG: 30S ribosomal protein S3 [Legionellales bacterium]
MGQKSHPNGLRLGIIREHDAIWFPANNESYAANVHSDIKIRSLIDSSLPEGAGISRKKIERTGDVVKITLAAARPGNIIGKKGAAVDKLRGDLSAMVGSNVNLNIIEIRKPELDSLLVAKNVCSQLERRVMFRKAVKRVISSAMRSGAQGIKVMVSGRLGGAEIARSESYREGRVPLHTFRADIDYGFFEALTTYGIIGVKVWIFKGEILSTKKQNSEA